MWLLSSLLILLIEEDEEEEEEEEEEEDDDVDVFGEVTEEENEEEKKRREAVAAEKAKKPPLIQRSNIILDVKVWEADTDFVKLEELVRGIQMDGLLWGPSKLAAVAYTVRKLQISCVVEDEKICTEDLEERIMAFEDYVQSVDIAAFTKV